MPLPWVKLSVASVSCGMKMKIVLITDLWEKCRYRFAVH